MDPQPKQFRASVLDATSIILRGKVTDYDGYKMQVTCDGPWGEIVLEFKPPILFDDPAGRDEIVEVKLR